MTRLRVSPLRLHRQPKTARRANLWAHLQDAVSASNRPALTVMVLAWLFTGGLVLGGLLPSHLWAAPLAQSGSLADDLLITEYIDGDGNNKAIEIYNGTGRPITLAGYALDIYDGDRSNNTRAQSIKLNQLQGVNTPPSLGDGDILVITRPGSVFRGYESEKLVFDGNDAILLSKNNVTIDSLGQTGSSPGSGWTGSTGGVTTRRAGLRRLPQVCVGGSNPTLPFDPSLEWSLAPSNTDASNLGRHGPLNCRPPMLNEFVLNHAGGGEQEYIEVKFFTDRSSDTYWVLAVDGSRAAGNNPGEIYYSRQIQDGEIQSGGYWTTPFPPPAPNQFRDRTTTLMLVRNYRGRPGVFEDLDPGNVGTITNALWDEVVDDVATVFVDSDFTYAAQTGVILRPGIDGNNTPFSGASRLPDGQRSGLYQSWTRNHFGGEGLSCRSCVPGATTQEALNTPGKENRPGTYPPVTVTVTPTFTTTPVTPLPPDRTPLPPNCTDIILDGDFEDPDMGWGAGGETGWKFGEDPVPPRYASDQRRTGLRALILGNPPDDGSVDRTSYSSVRQLVNIPDGATIAYITWSHLSLSQEAAGEVNANTDRQEMIPLAPNQMPISIKYRTRVNDSNWKDERRDLTELIGKNFYVYFNVYNDGNGLRTWMYLDNVRLVVCRPDAPAGVVVVTPTPMPLPTAVPVAEPRADGPIAPPILVAPVCTPPPCVAGGELICPGGECAGGCGMVCIPPTEMPVAPEIPIVPADDLQPGGENDAVIEPNAALPDGCIELVRNGNFEKSGVGWTIPPSESTVEYSTAVTYGDSVRAMRIASLTDPNRPNIAKVEQVVQLPDNYSNIRLDFRYYPLYDAAPGEGDLQYMDIYNHFLDQWERRVLSVQRNDQSWLLVQEDLNDLAGEEIRLTFAVNNDGVSGRSAMYIDDVSILACGKTGESNSMWAGTGPVTEQPIPAPAAIEANGVTAQPTASSRPQAATPAPRRQTPVAAASPLSWLDRLGTVAVLLGILVVIGALILLLLALRDYFGWLGLGIVLALGLGVIALALYRQSWRFGPFGLAVLIVLLIGILVWGLYLISNLWRRR